MNGIKIFVVEDDSFYGKSLHHHLSLNPEHEVETFTTGKDVLDNLYRKPSIITLDYSLPDISGKEVLSKIKEFDQDIPVIIISGQEDVSTAVDLLKHGAYEYIVKDNDTKDRLWNTIVNIKEKIQLKNELSILRDEVNTKYEFSNIKGNSQILKKIFGLIDKAANTNITVSITGETGTGKELVAKAIHYNSARKKKPLITVNVAAIPKELIESELFGHEKGAFTGAVAKRIGKFEEANGGTILLDEIGEMDLHMQTKLLRVLQEKEISRIGGNEVIKINVRVIVATHKKLAEEVKKGNFREDLYYRLLGLPIELPPLRDRGNDILVLAKYFADEFAKENGMKDVSFTAEAQDKLLNYSYPGNVRELKAIVELAIVMAGNTKIDAEDIAFNSTNSMTDFLFSETTLKEYNRKIMKHFLEKYDNNVLLVAKKLDIGKSTIYRMIKNGEIEI